MEVTVYTILAVTVTVTVTATVSFTVTVTVTATVAVTIFVNVTVSGTVKLVIETASRSLNYSKQITRKNLRTEINKIKLYRLVHSHVQK